MMKRSKPGGTSKSASRAIVKRRQPDADTIEFDLIQRQMAAAIMTPLTPKGLMRRRRINGGSVEKMVAQFIKPNDRLTSLERLEIYNRQYWFRLLESMQDDYPGLVAIMGQRKFLLLAQAYLSRHPSTSFTLRNLGSRLEKFLRAEPQWGKPHRALVLDMARFEWAQIVAFDGPSRSPIKAAHLLGKDPSTLHLALQPHISLLALQYPLDDFAAALKSDHLRAEASNANAAHNTRRHRQRLSIPQPQKVCLVAYRLDNTVYYKRVAPEAFLLLGAIAEGISLEKSLELAMGSAQDTDIDWPTILREWFTLWAQLGWFYHKND